MKELPAWLADALLGWGAGFPRPHMSEARRENDMGMDDCAEAAERSGSPFRKAPVGLPMGATVGAPEEILLLAGFVTAEPLPYNE